MEDAILDGERNIPTVQRSSIGHNSLCSLANEEIKKKTKELNELLVAAGQNATRPPRYIRSVISTQIYVIFGIAFNFHPNRHLIAQLSLSIKMKKTTFDLDTIIVYTNK